MGGASSTLLGDDENTLSPKKVNSKFEVEEKVYAPSLQKLGVLSYQQLLDLKNVEYFPGKSINEEATLYIKMVLEVQKSIYIMARCFLNKKSKKNKSNLLPVEIVKSIMLNPVLYPDWYHPRIKEDVDLIFKLKFKYPKVEKGLSSQPIPALLFSSKSKPNEIESLTQEFSQVALQERSKKLKKPWLSPG